jgi:outer membrane protein
MKNFCSFLVILILFFGIAVSANESIRFVDMDFVINQSNAGKQITEELSKKHKSNIKKFSKIEQSLKEEEKKIIAKKIF